MDPQGVGLLFSFAAGVVSFASPCILPLIPAFLSYVTGLTAEELRAGSGLRGRILSHSLAFVLGLSLVFTLLGASASAVGLLLLEWRPVITRLAGLVIILFALNLLGVVRIPLLWRQRGGEVSRFRGRGPAGAFLMGAAFAVGWTPCVGLVLGSIYALASQSHTLLQGMSLLFLYSLGLGLPFVLAGLGLGTFERAARRLRPHLGGLERASGAVLLALGVLVLTNNFLYLTAWLIRTFGIGLTL